MKIQLAQYKMYRTDDLLNSVIVFSFSNRTFQAGSRAKCLPGRFINSSIRWATYLDLVHKYINVGM